jgi:hypothetical protein
MGTIAEIAAGFLKPVADVIEHITVSGEDKAKLQLAQVQAGINAAQSAMDYERQLLDGQQKIILAEASSGGWLTRSWRPITMLTFLALVVCDSFGWLPNKLAPQAWTLLQVGLGGYTIGRSLEKVGPAIAGVFKAQ